jgi:hypothetical protein
MNISFPTNKHVVWIGSGIIIIFILASALDAYATPWLDPVSKSFKKLYPAAFVDQTAISIEDADSFVALAKNMDGSVSSIQAFNTYLGHAKSELLLKKLGIKVKSDVATDELNFYKKSNPDSYSQFLEKYFRNSDRLFTQNIVFPAVTEVQLRIKYNSDFNLNKDAYQKAENILERLNAGEKFENLAKQFSDDKQSAQFGGDLGFFEHGQILPELEQRIVLAKSGEVHDIIVTRDGYEIVLPIETSMIEGKKMWHAKHILIATSGFDQWLADQTKDIKVKTLKKY